MESVKIVAKQHQTLPVMNTRKTIGLLIDWIDNQYQLNLLDGITDLVKEKDLNLLIFEGGVINSQNEKLNTAYHLVNQKTIDGLIILPASIGRFLSPELQTQFCKQYQPLPTVIIGLAIPGFPSVAVDNHQFRELVVHLIEVHGYRHFAFIKGAKSSLDAIIRYDIFLKTIAEYNIPIEPNLIVQGDYTYTSGETAIRLLIDERNAKFDIVMACNDDMALGAISELSIRGFKVPEEVAVVGFDNLDLGRYSSPALTTIGYSVYELGRRSVELLLDLFVQKEVPMFESFPTKLVLRESCGCRFQIIGNNIFSNQKNEPEPRVAPVPKSSPMTVTEPVFTEMITEIQCLFADFKRFDIPEIVAKLSTTLLSELNEKNDRVFQKAWQEILDSGLRINKDVSVWQTVISVLRHHLLPYFPSPRLLLMAEDILQQARIIIAEKALALEMYEHQKTIQLKNALDELSERLLFTLDANSSLNILAKTLADLGIKRCYLVVFEGKALQKSRLILAFDDQGRKDQESSITFPAQQFLPDHILVNDRRFTMLVGALSLPQTGFFVFEGPRDRKIYAELRRIISGTIQLTLFLNQIQDQAHRFQTQKEGLISNLNQSRKVMSGFIQAIALTVEIRDPYTAGHQQRVADLACAIATEMKLAPARIEGLRMAGIIHDFGKIYVPSEILNKPGRLSELEFNFIKLHSEVAYNILKDIDFPWPIAQIILQHHERINGSGYPSGLKGQNIKLESRILAVADVVEAMMSHRPYRAALGLDKALAEIAAGKGLSYDSRVVDQCIILFRDKKFQFN